MKTELHLFPLDRQVGKVRHVASKLMARSTERAAEHYRSQVTEAILGRLARAHVPEDAWDEQIGAFWQAVQDEMVRQTYCGSKSGGAA